MHKDKKILAIRMFELGIKYTSILSPRLNTSLQKVERHLYESHISNIKSDHLGLKPLDVIGVDPNKITRYSDSPFRNKKIPFRFGFGKILEGNWDKNRNSIYPEESRDILNDYVIVGFEEYFKQNIEWKNTSLYKKCQLEIEKGNPVWRGCKSIDEVDNQFRKYEKIYHKISSEGYKSQDSLYSSRSTLNNRRNEILVDISRHGELLFVDGFHRFVITRILDINPVPVVILCRHKNWIDNREQLLAEISVL